MNSPIEQWWNETPGKWFGPILEDLITKYAKEQGIPEMELWRLTEDDVNILKHLWEIEKIKMKGACHEFTEP